MPPPDRANLTQRDRRIRRIALGSSSTLHALSFVFLIVAPPWLAWLFNSHVADQPPPITVVARGAWDEPPSPDPLLEQVVELSQAGTKGVSQPGADERGAEELASGESLARDVVRRRVDRAIAEAQRLDAPQQLDRLRELSGELNEVSSAESLDVIADQLQRLLGTKERATAPVEEPIAGPFDFTTAQVHDVRRLETDQGEPRYVIVMLDAAGRQFETELGGAEGEQLYRTFELIKQNPLLEKVYRRIVMSLLDKMLDKPAPAPPPP